MEESYYDAASRINATEIWTFVKVAPVACKGKVVWIIRTAVLPRDDMFDVVGQVCVALVQAAVFATRSSALPHHLPRGRIHSLAGMCLD